MTLLNKLNAVIVEALYKRAQVGVHAAFPDDDNRMAYHLNEFMNIATLRAFGEGSSIGEVRIIPGGHMYEAYFQVLPVGAENDEEHD